MDLSQDLIVRICKLLPDIRDKLTFLSLRRHYKLVCDYGIITELEDQNQRLTDQILRQPKFRHLKILRLSEFSRVTSLNCLENLEILRGGSKITQEGIANCTKLRRLYLGSHSGIKSVNHLTELEVLAVLHTSKISQEGIMGCLKLKRLITYGNPRITSVNHLTELEELDASYGSGITQEEIMGCLKLKKLNIDGNRRITSVNHLTELEELDASGVTCRLSQEGIMGCLKLKRLITDGNPQIRSVNHLSELEE